MNETRTSRTRPAAGALILSLLGSALLAACGGGGGGGTTVVVPPALVDANAVTRGFWSGTLNSGPDGSTRASAVVMPDLTTWVAYETATGVVGVSKVTLTATASNATTASITGSGRYYPLSGAASSALSASGTATSSALSGTLTVGSANAAMAWTQVSGFTTAATTASLAGGTFTGALGGGTVSVTWAIDAAGSLVPATSVSTSGCTYTGTVRPNSGGVAVYDVAVQETCAGTARALAGIATLRAASTGSPASLRVIYTADSGASGGLLALDKQ